jgi:chaperonin cofactor prefoldin
MESHIISIEVQIETIKDKMNKCYEEINEIKRSILGEFL